MQIKTVMSLKIVLKVVPSIFYFIKLFHLGLPKYHKIIKLKVNCVLFIELLTDINKQTY